jgi:polynucleotide 5'-kinase involved in rRNA processing
MSSTSHRVGEGDTLLLDGPASLRITSGRASILGCTLKPNKSYLMRPHRRYPAYAETDFHAEVRLGEGAGAKIIKGDSIGEDWRDVANRLQNGSTVAVMGGSDTGKTAFATLVANTLCKRYGGTAILCLDPGQSYLSPPSTIAAALLREPTYDLAQAKAFTTLPVGSTSASQDEEAYLRAVQRLMEHVRKTDAANIVADLDGWVEGGEAETLKERLVQIIKPSHLISIDCTIERVVEAVMGWGGVVNLVKRPSHILERSSGVRREIRSMSYSRYLKNASVRTIPLGWVDMEVLSESLPEYPTLLNNVKPDAGLLTYLAGEDEAQYHIGVTTKYDRGRRVVKIYTAMAGPVKRIAFGRVLLTVEGDEVGYL